jgi:hypothetical protein
LQPVIESLAAPSLHAQPPRPAVARNERQRLSALCQWRDLETTAILPAESTIKVEHIGSSEDHMLKDVVHSGDRARVLGCAWVTDGAIV